MGHAGAGARGGMEVGRVRDEWRERLARWKKYRYAALVVLLGVVLMLLPASEEESVPPSDGDAWESFDRAAVQSEMEDILSAIDGVGALRLMLTVEGGGERRLAESSTVSQGQTGTETRQEKREPLVLSRGSGTQEVVVTGSTAPRYLGALVVCEGAGSASVRLAVTEAVAVLTALPSDRITVVQGKP